MCDIDLMQSKLTKMRSQVQANCVMCRSRNERGPGLEFTPLEDGGVESVFNCDKAFEGYDKTLHGGVTSALLDQAMTDCMFAQGCSAVTVELAVQSLRPVVIGQMAIVRAWITRSTPLLCVVEGEVLQEWSSRCRERMKDDVRKIRWSILLGLKARKIETKHYRRNN